MKDLCVVSYVVKLVIPWFMALLHTRCNNTNTRSKPDVDYPYKCYMHKLCLSCKHKYSNWNGVNKLIVFELISRYKYVCLVTIGEKAQQEVCFGSRCVCDKQWDNYSSATYENFSLYAMGVVYALYYE